MALYAQTAGTLSTNSSTFTPIQGLTLTIPEGVGTTAIIILNVPMPYATGTDIPGGTFGIALNGAVSTVTASFTYNEGNSVELWPHSDHAGRRHPARQCGSDRPGGLVRRPRQHRDHRQPGDADRNPLKPDLGALAHAPRMDVT
jgi:hypothetical protein